MGSLITVAGVGLAVALAIQNGLLGPLGRVLLSVLLAVLLLGAGLWLDRRRPAEGTVNPGVSALVVTSFITVALVVNSLFSLLGWWPRWLAVAVVLAVWIAYLALTRVRKMRMVGFAMCIVAVFLVMSFFTSEDAGSWPIVIVPLTLLALTWKTSWNEVRFAAAATAVIVQIGYTLTVWSEATILTVLVGIVTALVFAGVSMFDSLEDNSTNMVTGIIAPLVLLLVSVELAEGTWTIWLFIPATAALAALGYSRSSKMAIQLAPIALAATAVAFVFVWEFTPPLGSGARLDSTIVVALFFIAAIGTTIWLAMRNENRIWPWAFWLGAALIVTWNLSRNVLSKTPLWLTDNSALIQALLIVAFLVVAIRLRRSLAVLPIPAQVIFAVAGLHLSMVALVTISTWVGTLVGNTTGMWLGYLVGHAGTSILWMILAAWILLAARGISERASLGAGMVLAIAGVVKLVFFDLGNLEGLPRAVAFLVCGVALLAMAALRARRKDLVKGPANDIPVAAPTSSTANPYASLSTPSVQPEEPRDN
ncbi:membrane protein [Corynebacterium atrinae]